MAASISQTPAAAEAEAEAEMDFFRRLEQLIAESSPSMSTSPRAPSGEPVTAAPVLRAQGAPSVSIAILDQGTISSHVIASEFSTDTLTMFQACSISKAVFGTLIMSLIDRGRFTLTDKMVNLLPASTVDILKSNNPATVPLLNQITVANLMSHTAGTSVSGFPGYPVSSHGDRRKGGCPDVESIIAGSSGVDTMPIRVIAPPGIEWMYSGGGTTLLQAIVEHTTGEPMEKTMKKEIFDVLGMDRSCYYLDEGRNDGKEDENIARAWYNGFTPCHDRHHTQPELGAAGLWTTPTDLLQVINSIQRSLMTSPTEDNVDDTIPSPLPLRKQTAQKMLTQIHNLNKSVRMAHSWFCDDTTFGHGGYNFPGFRSLVVGYADLSFNSPPLSRSQRIDTSTRENMSLPVNSGIAAMSNGRDSYEVILKIMHAIAYLKGWPDIGSHFGHVDPGVPFVVPDSFPRSSNDETWKDWIGEWTAKHESEDEVDFKVIWRIDHDAQGHSAAGIRTNKDLPGPDDGSVNNETAVVMTRLKKAACPPVSYAGGKRGHEFVMHGLEVLLRFGWRGGGDGDERVVTVRNHASQSVQVLYRV